MPPSSTPDVYTSIAHPIRRQILDMLMDDDRSVKEISSAFDISRPAISQHLAMLVDSGLVTRRQAGRENYYQLQPEGLEQIDAWIRHYRQFWTRKMDALGDFLDRMEDESDAT